MLGLSGSLWEDIGSAVVVRLERHENRWNSKGAEKHRLTDSSGSYVSLLKPRGAMLNQSLLLKLIHNRRTKKVKENGHFNTFHIFS